MRLTLVSHSFDGHRREYVSLAESLCKTEGHESRVVTSWTATLWDPAPVLFLMIEENFSGYLAAALARAVQGRRTAGLLFRGREAANASSTRLTGKRLLLKTLRKISGITTLSIVPFSVDPRLAQVADGWIDDPQLWDIEDTAPITTPLSQSLQEAASGRRIVISLGGQNEGKGFRFFTRAWAEAHSLRDRWLFVAAGKVAAAEAESAAAFKAAGGLLLDRFISDEELASLYGIADVIWGVYAPTYDQASGIFGRAVQYDAPILVRRGSAIEAHGLQLGARAASVDYGEVAQIEDALNAALETPTGEPGLRSEMRARNVATLFSALLGPA